MLSKRQKRPDILAQWARLPIPVDSSGAPAERRERLVNAVARAMLAAKERPPIRPRTYAALGAAVAIVALTVVGGLVWRGSMTSEPVAAHLFALSGSWSAVVHGREIVSSSATSGGLPLARDSQVSTGRASSSRLQLRSGVEVTVGPDTQLTLPATRDPTNVREELVLEGGLISVQVPKLPRGHAFAVRTPAAVVSVHGTAFSVEVTKSAGSGVPKTTVIVTEGVVSVQHADREVLLNAGAEWSSSSENVAAGAPTSSSGPITKPVPPLAAHRQAKRPDRESASATSTVLDASALPEQRTDPALASQNRLFSDAMSARDRGDSTGAIGLLEDFIQRYPGAPLAQDAYVERFRVLAEMGKHAAAARAARSYLALYPNGFAGEEAKQLALALPGGL